MEAISKRTYRFVIGATLLSTFTFGQIEKDKKLHYAAGSVIGVAGYVYSYDKHQDKKRAMINGVCLSFAAGVMKELYDGEIANGYVELNDVLATTLGGITFVYIANLLNKKQNKTYRKLDKIKGGYYYEKNYKKINYTNYTTFYELDFYTSYNTRQSKKSKKK